MVCQDHCGRAGHYLFPINLISRRPEAGGRGQGTLSPGLSMASALASASAMPQPRPSLGQASAMPQPRPWPWHGLGLGLGLGLTAMIPASSLSAVFGQAWPKTLIIDHKYSSTRRSRVLPVI